MSLQLQLKRVVVLVVALCAGLSADARADDKEVKERKAVQAAQRVQARAAEEKVAEPERDAAADEAGKLLRKKLLSRAEIAAENVPLKEFIEKLSKDYDIPLRIDEAALKQAGIAVDVPISAKVKKGTLNTVLKQALTKAGLRAVVQGKELLVTTAEAEAAHGGAMRAAAPVMVAAVNEDQQIEQQALQFMRQFQALDKAELYFLSEMCGVDKEVTVKLKAGNEERAKVAARKFSAAQHRMMRGQAEGGGHIDARSLIQDGLLAALKDGVTPEQLAKYEKQRERRAEFRKSAAVHNLVGKLDRELVLSESQREKFLEVLSEKWDENWGRSMQLFLYGDQYFPQIPDSVILPHLEGLQKEIWRGMPKTQHNIFFGGLGMMGNEIEDFPIDDAGAQAVPGEQLIEGVQVIAVEAAPAEEPEVEE